MLVVLFHRRCKFKLDFFFLKQGFATWRKGRRGEEGQREQLKRSVSRKDGSSASSSPIILFFILPQSRPLGNPGLFIRSNFVTSEFSFIFKYPKPPSIPLESCPSCPSRLFPFLLTCLGSPWFSLTTLLGKTSTLVVNATILSNLQLNMAGNHPQHADWPHFFCNYNHKCSLNPGQQLEFPKSIHILMFLGMFHMFLFFP